MVPCPRYANKNVAYSAAGTLRVADMQASLACQGGLADAQECARLLICKWSIFHCDFPCADLEVLVVAMIVCAADICKSILQICRLYKVCIASPHCCKWQKNARSGL